MKPLSRDYTPKGDCALRLFCVTQLGRLRTDSGMFNYKLRVDRILLKNSAYKLSQSLLLTDGFQFQKIVNRFLNICSIDL